jgi:BirA family biotin operon repressor/biotin-[acetyl-CoA-carboxylase] ligase
LSEYPSRIYDTTVKIVTQNSDVLKDIISTYERTLKPGKLGRPFRFERSLESTNRTARDWAMDGGPHGALVFAESQTQGRGRRGRGWQSQPGVNLTFSVILRPNSSSDAIELITLAAGLAMMDTLGRYFPALNIQIKWPNDVLIESRKCSGILLESSIGADWSEKFVILGVGLNVNQTTFPEELEKTATSVFLETGHPQDRIGILVGFLSELEIRISQASADRKAFLRDYESHLAGMGSAVQLISFDGGRSISGKILGVAEDGSMRLQTASGVRAVYAGDVTFDNELGNIN